MARQCELLGLARSTYYYEPAQESPDNRAFMRRIDEQYLKTPFHGGRKMAEELSMEECVVNRKRVQRLMRTMGIAAIYPRRNTTIPCVDHRVYPYLLRGLTIDRANQVWCSDPGAPGERGWIATLIFTITAASTNRSSTELHTRSGKPASRAQHETGRAARNTGPSALS